jgi:hypothetical protein
VASNPQATQADVDKAISSLVTAAVQLQLQQQPVLDTVAKVTTKSVKVTGKAFTAKTKPSVTVTIALSAGVAKGKVAVYVGKKKVKTVKVTKAKTVVKLPKKYAKAVKIKAKYTPTAATNGTAKTSAVKTIKVKK